MATAAAAKADNPKAPKVASIKPVSPNPDYLHVNPVDRVHVFIDGNNLMGMLRYLDLKLDYKRFMLFLRSQTRLVRAHYFALMRDDMPAASTGVIDMIEYAGFEVVRKYGKEAPIEGTSNFRFRGSVIPEITVSLIEAALNGCEHAVIISGDGELYSAVEAAKTKGTRITLIGIKESTSDDLRRSCDSFIDIESLPKEIFYS
jgi:uncharacterized LabA/DUF88 family protein